MHKKEFCTSGPVNKETCYYLERPILMKKVLNFIEKWKYFTISAPRQTGKTTFLNDILNVIKDKYMVISLSFETYTNKNEEKFLKTIVFDIQRSMKKIYDLDYHFPIPEDIDSIRNLIEQIKEKTHKEIVFMIDEFELFYNTDVMNSFLHVIRRIYHDKTFYGVRSFILISVSYLNGILSDTLSPFNISEHITLPYFTEQQVYDLLSQHEKEENQYFSPEVKNLIWKNAAGQPGLTNAIAKDLVENKAPNKKIIEKSDFEKTYYDFTRKYLDKNIENIISKAEIEDALIKKILFEPNSVEFDISDKRIQHLYVNGIIDDLNGYCAVRVPLYHKKLYNHFKPKINGEKAYMISFYDSLSSYLNPDGLLDLNKLMEKYVSYVKKRGASMFKGKKYYEGVYQYNLDSFLNAYLEELGGKVYPETEIGGGRIDLLINYKNHEYLLEVKSNPTPRDYENGKEQIFRYLSRNGQNEGWYVIFSDTIKDFDYKLINYKSKNIHTWFIKTAFSLPSNPTE